MDEGHRDTTIEGAASEELYDTYLDACLAGTADEPAAFAARHGVDDPDFVAQLQALYDEARRAGTARSAVGPLPFEQLGEFRLVRPLDAGGMGLLFEAVQTSLDRTVALKLVRPELTRSAHAVERFQREARLVARLRHPHIVNVIAYGEDAGVHYIAMELLEGRNLDQVLDDVRQSRESPDLPTLAGWMRDVARALHHAHAHGVVHRDIKPSNVFLDREGTPRVLDFGIAHDDDGASITQTFAGSPLYAAPEQVLGHDVDGRTDVYAIGATLYRALTGRAPFEGGGLDHVIRRVLAEEPVPPRKLNTAVSKDLETVVLKALEKKPGARYATAAALADDLDAVLAGRSIQARPPGPIERARKWSRRNPARAAVVGVSLAAVAGFLIYLEMSRRAELRERRHAARVAYDEAELLATSYGADRDADDALAKELATLRDRARGAWQPTATWERLEALEDRITQRAREREESFWEALDLLRRAESLDPTLAVDEARAALYMQRLRESEALRDDTSAAFYRRQVRRYDKGSRFRAPSSIEVPCTIHVEPVDADLYVFRYRLQSELVPGGEPRFVPVPIRGGETRVPYGTVCLRVVRGAQGVPPGAHILSIAGQPIAGTYFVGEARPPIRTLDRFVSQDGQDLPPLYAVGAKEEVELVFERDGEPYTIRATGLRALGVTLQTPAEVAARGGVRARVLIEQDIQEIALPTGLAVRPTARPLLRWDAARLTGTSVTLSKGEYLVIARKAGYETLRHAVHVHEPGELALDLPMLPEGTTPQGFVRIPAIGSAPAYWIMEREVSSREYIAFLRDPATRRTIDSASRPIYYPRGGFGQPKGLWNYEPGKPLRFPEEGWDPNWPVLGVSFEDASAYAAWRTQQAQARGESVVFGLPTQAEWALAALGAFSWRYVHGDRFRAHWMNSCRSHRHAFPEPAFRYPVDESPYGLFDCTGNAAEWLDAWEDETRNLRRVALGSWGLTDAEHFLVWGTGRPANRISGSYGFRLVMRPQ